MSDKESYMPSAEAELAVLQEAQASPFLKRYWIYTKMSGPGWLQGAITLGGGSLAGALYLGVIAGYGMMWLQPLAMICGVITLSAIAYVTLSTGRRPFGLLKQEISPVLAWAWLIAAALANVVWCMPQFSLAYGAMTQNIMPAIGSGNAGKLIICVALLAIGLGCNVLYEKGGAGLVWFERLLKVLVGMIVISFILVVGTLISKGQVDLGRIASGFIPNFAAVDDPAPAYRALIDQTGEYAQFWTDFIVRKQKNIMIAAFGTAVGINMTFLLPYSILKKKWGVERRGLAIYDLALGLIVPFVLATACVVVASASQFHAKTSGVLDENGLIQADVVGTKIVKDFNGTLDRRLKQEYGLEAWGAMDDVAKQVARDTAPDVDRQLAAMLVKRDNIHLATTLEPLAGKTVSQMIFGFGVFGMAVSTIIMLMLINGFVFREMLGKPKSTGAYMAGCTVSGVGGFMGPFVWSGASAYLAVPTSAIGASLLPIACLSFWLMMNSRRVLGDAMLTGGKRIGFNILMAFATGFTTLGVVWVLLGKNWTLFGMKMPAGEIGIGILILLAVLGVVGFVQKNKKASAG